MTRRDMYILAVIGVVAVIGGFWFLMLGPKRDELKKANTQVGEAQTSLQTARQEAEQFAKARLDFPTDYATLARLGKAVPADPDVPSLVVQLDRAANRAKVDFRKLTLESGSGGSSAASAPANTPPPSASAESSSSSSGTGATGAGGATGANGAGAGSASGTGSASGATAPSASASASATAPANATAVPTMPLGVEVGSAGLSVAHYNLVFDGNFFRMADLIHNVRSLVQRRNRQLVVSGRLITIDGISLGKGNFGFPQVKATITATTYLAPQSQGLFAGATVQGPAGASSATPVPPSNSNASAPPSAVVGAR
jgi:hypothetical protein